MAEFRAAAVDGIRSQATSDGKMGLLLFQRMRPDPSGSRELNIAAPVPLLPYIAAAALEAIPQPEGGSSGKLSVLLGARSIQVGLGPEATIVLTVEMEMGARISFSIGQAQAESLQQTVSIALGRRRAQALRASLPPRPPRAQ